MLRSAIGIAASIGCLCVVVARCVQDTRSGGVLRGQTLVESGGVIRAVQITRADRADSLECVAVAERGTELVRGEASVIATATSIGPPSADQRLSTVVLPNGWVIIRDVELGAGGALFYWTGGGALCQAGGGIARAERVVQHVALMDRDARTIERSEVADRDLLDNVWDPQLVEHDGKCIVVANGWGPTRPDSDKGGVIWAAELPLDDPTLVVSPEPGKRNVLVAKAITQGSNPRIASFAGGYILTYRLGGASVERAPIRALRSVDLRTWVPDNSFPAGRTAGPCYAVVARGKAVWVATATKGAEKTTIKISKYSSDTSTWRDYRELDVAKTGDQATHKPIVWMLGGTEETPPTIGYSDGGRKLSLLR
jgi:hypothetical protein